MPDLEFVLTDEHYMSTLLATQGRDEETDCSGSVTHANWDDIEHFFHPKTYQVHEVTAQLLFGLRQPQHVSISVDSIECLHNSRQWAS